MNHQLAIRLAGNASAGLGKHPVPEVLITNAIQTAAEMERRGIRSVNVELVVGRALATRAECLTHEQAEELVRGCESVLDDVN
jgi:hypothetical protein